MPLGTELEPIGIYMAVASMVSRPRLHRILLTKRNAPERAMVELQWSLIGLWMIQLLVLKEQVKARDPNQQASIAVVLRIVRIIPIAAVELDEN